MKNNEMFEKHHEKSAVRRKIIILEEPGKFQGPFGDFPENFM